jgi:hypothetical protein
MRLRLDWLKVLSLFKGRTAQSELLFIGVADYKKCLTADQME